MTFTMLRVPLSRLWLDPESRPKAVTDGRVEIDGDPNSVRAATVPSPSPTTTEASAVDAGTHPVAASPEPGPPDAPVFAVVAHDEDEVPWTGMPAVAIDADADANQDHAHATAPLRPTEEEASAHKKSRARSGNSAPVERGSKPERVASSPFLQWLVQNIRDGKAKINVPDARLHVTPLGLLLVSPALFRDFVGFSEWMQEQRKFQRLKLHLKRPDDTNIWTFRVAGDRRQSSLLKGLILPDAGILLGLDLPPPNPHLTQADDAGTGTGVSTATTETMEMTKKAS